MKRFITPLIVGVALLVSGCQDNGGGKVTLKDLNDSASYAIGVNVAMSQLKPNLDQAKQQGIEINGSLVAAAIRDVLTDSAGQGMIPDSLVQSVLMRWQEEFMTKKKEENKAFLEENKGKSGVQTTPSGLQYIVVEEGSGESPSETDSVVVKYKGMLTDSTVFDQSPEGGTATFYVGQLIQGWQEALKMMKPGAKWKLFIPSDLAYGDQGTMGIPPGATLIFDMELVSIKK